MNLEDDLFRSLRADTDKLKEYGFVPDENGYVLKQPFFSGVFNAEIRVGNDGRVSGEVYDAETGEAFVQVRTPGAKGSYVAEVREAYLQVLKDAAQACFTAVPFTSDQANRIAARIRETYGAEPEHLWDKYPSYGVFRCAGNRKWFALVLNAERSLFEEGSGEVDVLDIKASPQELADLYKRGMFPGYHMNRRNWVSIILDERMPDDEIMELLAKSYKLAGGNRTPAEPGVWVIPANPKYYDVEAAFRRSDTIGWHQHGKMQKGDTLYIYYAAPYSCLLYRCEITETDIPVHYGKYRLGIRIRRTHAFRRGALSLEILKEHGLSAVRSARSMPAQTEEFIAEAIKEGSCLL